MVLRANEYEAFVKEFKTLKDRRDNEEKFIKESQERLKNIKKAIKKLEDKL